MASFFGEFDEPTVTYEVQHDAPFKIHASPETLRTLIEGKKQIELFFRDATVGSTVVEGSLFGNEQVRWQDQPTGHESIRQAFDQDGRRIETDAHSWLRENARFGDQVAISPDGSEAAPPPENPASPEGIAAPDPEKSEKMLAFVPPAKPAPTTIDPQAGIPIPGQMPDRAYEAVGDILGVPQSPFGATIGNMIPFSDRPTAAGANLLTQFRNSNPEAIGRLGNLPVEAQREALSAIARYIFDLDATGFHSLPYETQLDLAGANIGAIINLYAARAHHFVVSEGQPVQPAGTGLPLSDLIGRVMSGYVSGGTVPGDAPVSGEGLLLPGTPGEPPPPYEYQPRNPLDHDPEWAAAREELRRSAEALQNAPAVQIPFPENFSQRRQRQMDEIGAMAGDAFLQQWQGFLQNNAVYGLEFEMFFHTEGMSSGEVMTYMNLLMKGVPEHVVLGIMRGDDPNEVVRWFDSRNPATSATLDPSERRDQAQQEIERRLNDPKSPFDNDDWRRYEEAFPDIAEELFRIAAQGVDPAAVAEAAEQLLRGATAHSVLHYLRNSGAGGSLGGPPGGGGPGTVAGAPDDPGVGSSLSEIAQSLIEGIPLENIPRRINPSMADLISGILRNEPIEAETDATNRVERFIPENLYQTPTELGRLAMQALTDPLAHVQNPSAMPLLSDMGVIAEGSRMIYASAGGMKGVNTEFGHGGGDRLISGYLINLARELRNAFPEAGGEIHVFKDRSTDVIIVAPPHLESRVIDLLQEFGSRPSMFTTELPGAEFAILNPGLGIQPFGEFPVDSEGRFDLSVFERLYQSARAALEQRKLAGEVPNYPERGASPFIIVQDPAELEGMIPLEGADVPATDNRLRLNEYLRQGGDRLIEALERLSEEAFAQVRRELLTNAFTNPHVDGIFNNRMEVPIPIGPDGQIVPDPVMGFADLQKLGVINNGIGQALEDNALGWGLGDGAIRALTGYLQVLQERFDVFVAMPGGDEVIVTGSREAVEQLFAELQRMLQGTVLQAPGPDGQMFELRGLSGAFAIGPIDPDAPHPFPDPLEMERMLQENGAQTGYWPPLFGPDGQPIPVPRP
jgi:GGDEF domain-containing protein